MDESHLLQELKAVLKQNDHGDYTAPAQGIYPHQWLWDSCFIAIGLRHYDLARAQLEIIHLLRGQWANGMIPNMILRSTSRKDRDGNIWRSWINPLSPDNVATSGITQPPLLAEAILAIGEKLKLPERRSWYKTVFPALLNYHEWLYRDRDPHNEGLVLQLHPWETGLDNTPPWMAELKEHLLPFWIRIIDRLHLDTVINFFRRDLKHHIPAEQRMDTVEALALYHMQRRLRRKHYITEKALTHSLLILEDLGYNCMFIRANDCLKQIAKTINYELPPEFLNQMKKTEEALEQLWDPYSGMYFSRNFVTHHLVKEPTIGTLLPLYAGSISKERAEHLVKLLEDTRAFGTPNPVPTVPLTSSWFKPLGYWQGPTWINTNWMIIEGLKRYGFHQQAQALKEKTIEMVKNFGVYEYYSPTDGTPGGAPNFSWSAALTIDLLKT